MVFHITEPSIKLSICSFALLLLFQLCFVITIQVHILEMKLNFILFLNIGSTFLYNFFLVSRWLLAEIEGSTILCQHDKIVMLSKNRIEF